MNLLLGLGIIGSRCADQLAQQGHPLITWNRSPKDRPDLSSDLAADAARATRVLCYLRDDQAVRELFTRLADQLRPGTAFLNHATIDPATTRWLAAECERRGLEFLDAPFTGSRDAAAAGELTYYVSAADPALLEKHRPVLAATSRLIVPLGAPPAATILKITTNLLTATTVQALAEALTICQQHDIAPDAFLQALQGNATCSKSAEMKLRAIADTDLTPHFSTENMLKDADYARQLAHEKNLHLPALEATAAQLRQAAENGHAQNDFSSVAQLLKP
ncbi:MAG: NAD(P)-dependent oxidoreductase [Verrucomicrobiales bacterium]